MAVLSKREYKKKNLGEVKSSPKHYVKPDIKNDIEENPKTYELIHKEFLNQNENLLYKINICGATKEFKINNGLVRCVGEKEKNAFLKKGFLYNKEIKESKKWII